MEALATLAGPKMEAGQHSACIGLYREAMVEDPYREDLDQELVKALAEVGRPAEAIPHLEGCGKMHPAAKPHP